MHPKTKKTTPPHLVIATEAGLESALHRYVDLCLTLVRRKTRQEQAVAALQALHREANEAAEAESLSLEAGIQLYCTAHRESLFPEGGKKSREYDHATVGFRLNPYSVQKLLPRDTWDRIAQRLAALPWAEGCVETRRSVNKEELLRRRNDLTEAQLMEAGVQFRQGETFFLEPKSELLEAARHPAAGEAAA